MTKQDLKEEILKTVSNELDYWLEREGQIDDFYEYEKEFNKVAFRIDQHILQKSLGKVPKGRNGKKNC